MVSLAQRIVIPLDFQSLDRAEVMVRQLGPECVYKVGTELAVKEGWVKAIKTIQKHKVKVFVDAKLYDIPNTVLQTAQTLLSLKPDFMTVHVASGPTVLTELVKLVSSMKVPTKILGVTLPTGISDTESKQIYGLPVKTVITNMAKLAAKTGLDGIVCSAHEVKILNQGPQTTKLIKFTAGIRPKWALVQDQSRIMTPRQAIATGADYLIIGRPITQPPAGIGKPKQALTKILEELSE